MLKAIRGARHSITFETCIYWSGTIGREFADALAERARAGVAVHVMLDWWGSDGIEELHLVAMRAAGIEVRRYNPPRLGSLGRMNNRTHRKLLVVDGSVGFIGGVGIADPWRGDAQDPQHWRDTHFRVAGPVVAQLQSAFLDSHRHRPRAARREVPAAARACRRPRGAGVHQRAGGRRRERPVHGPDVDRRGA